MSKLPKKRSLLFLCNIFAISLQYLGKEVSYEVHFLHVDKLESLPQIDTMFLMGMVKHSQSFQNSKFAMSLQYLKKEVRDEVDFLHAEKHLFNTLGIKVSYKLILSLLMDMTKHSQRTQSNRFAISLQYLRKEVRNGVHHQSSYKLALSFLMEVGRHYQKYPK